jgi:hypothetical protein
MPTKIRFPEEMFQGELNHPQCPFFEAFPSSPDPYEDFYGEFLCHMAYGNYAKICKGDYLLCPIAYGKLSDINLE